MVKGGTAFTALKTRLGEPPGKDAFIIYPELRERLGGRPGWAVRTATAEADIWSVYAGNAINCPLVNCLVPDSERRLASITTIHNRCSLLWRLAYSPATDGTVQFANRPFSGY